MYRLAALSRAMARRLRPRLGSSRYINPAPTVRQAAPIRSVFGPKPSPVRHDAIVQVSSTQVRVRVRSAQKSPPLLRPIRLRCLGGQRRPSLKRALAEFGARTKCDSRHQVYPHLTLRYPVLRPGSWLKPGLQSRSGDLNASRRTCTVWRTG